MKAKRRWKWALGGVAMITGAVFAFNTAYNVYYRNDLLKLYGGAEGLAVVAHPDRVEASRIAPISPSFSDWETIKPSALAPVSGPVRVPPDLVSRLSATLSSPRSYGWSYLTTCIPNYTSRLTFYRGKDRVDVFFCFGCRQLIVIRNGKPTGGEEFDASEGVIMGAFKQLFPKANFSG